MTREGGCFCGAIRYETTGEPLVVTHCHCLHCRRTSGAAFVTWAEFPADRFSWQKGKPGSFESRPGVTRTFCSGCGTPLTYGSIESPGSMDVVACTLDEPDRLEPRDHIFCDRKLPWIHIDDGLPRYPRQRGT